MGWEPLPDDVDTLAQMLAGKGVHTAAMVDTPFYLRGGMNYDRGVNTFSLSPGQLGSNGVNRYVEIHRESVDRRDAWRFLVPAFEISRPPLKWRPMSIILSFTDSNHLPQAAMISGVGFSNP